MAPHFSRPIYEGLPWLYIICGIGALLASYLLAERGLLSGTVGLLGLVCVVGGIVVLLRRRDYRALRSQYSNEDSSLSDDDKR